MTGLQSESITALMPALLDAQGEFKPAVKDAENPHFGSTFLSLGGVLNATAAALRGHRIAIVQLTDVDDQGRAVLLTRLVHESGEWIGARYPLNPVKNDPQAYGSALTYARRYGLMSLLGIVAEDDDGHDATEQPKQQRTREAAEPDAPFDTTPWEAKIAASSTTDELARVGSEVKATPMPDSARTVLRAQYAERLNELAGVTA